MLCLLIDSSVFWLIQRDELSEIDEKKDDHTELMRAALDGDSANVRALLASSADVNAKDSEGRTARSRTLNTRYRACKLVDLPTGRKVDS